MPTASRENVGDELEVLSTREEDRQLWRSGCAGRHSDDVSSALCVTSPSALVLEGGSESDVLDEVETVRANRRYQLTVVKPKGARSKAKEDAFLHGSQCSIV